MKSIVASSESSENLMNDLERTARQAAETSPNKEILSFEFEGARYWIKRGRATGSNFFHRTAWRLTGFPLLIPVLRQNAAESRQHEADKIDRLEKLGLSVPKVVLRNDEWFVMTDTGPNLRRLLYKNAEPDQSLILSAFTALGNLHSQGCYHGGSQLRNLTWSQKKIHFIDFEENFDESINLKTLQLRDLFLLLFSFAKDRIPVNYSRLIALYQHASGNDDFDRRLQQMFRKLGWLEKIIAFPPLWKLLDKDTKATYRLIQELKKF